MKRLFAAALIILTLFMLGCGSDAVTEPEITPDASAEQPVAEETPAVEDYKLLGMIIDDDGTDAAYMTMYGFLHTAETMGYAAKLYRASGAAKANEAAAEAARDGVDALVVFSPNGAFDSAIAEASAAGIYVAVPFFQCTAEGVECNVVADAQDYFDELARGLAERMTERSLKSGKILVYGRDTTMCKTMFEQSLAASYPQFTVDAFTRSTEDEQAAIDELAQHLLYNRDIKGMYVIDADSSALAVKARSQAQKLFRNDGAPSPTPTPTLAPGATPAEPTPTPNPGILKQISVTVFCNGLSDDNYGLFSDNDIYALLIEPYYEAAAQSVMAADRALRGESTAASYKVNRPLIYADTAEKYKTVYDRMKVMFSLNG